MTIEELVEIAKEVEIGDPFDWGNVNIHEESAYRLMAMGVMGMDMSEDVMRATIVKLCVENLVLNTKLMMKNA